MVRRKMEWFFRCLMQSGAVDAHDSRPETDDRSQMDMWGNFLVIFVLFRVIQRIYYFMKGHRQFLLDYNPANELVAWFKKEDILVSDHEMKSPYDGVLLKYKRIGNGKRVVLIANGVGTALYMWLPIFKNLLRLKPSMFTGSSGFTIIAPCYRGLFGSVVTNETKKKMKNKVHAEGSVLDPKYDDEVDITMSNCAQDLVDILNDAFSKGLVDATREINDKNDKERSSLPWKDGGEDYIHYECVIGWSMGAQCILTCMERNPFIAKKLFLLNPSSGRSLHTAFQPFFALPFEITIYWSALVRFLIVKGLRPLIRTEVWPLLKIFANSLIFRLILEFSSFWGGFPPEQGAYFSAYMHDVFSCREQTRGLLDLIVALDAPLESENKGSGGYGYKGIQQKTFGGKSEQTTILSGLPDIMTGIYHASILAANMSKRCSHKVYNMASHFLLLEWPELVAGDIVELLDHAYDSNFRRVKG